MNEYELPYSNLTLDEALARFRRENHLDEKYLTMTSEAQLRYERHDMIHVLFGLDTSMRHEAKADGWTLLASDLRWKDLREVLNGEEEKELVAELGWRSIALAYLRGVPDFLRMAWQSRKLRKKWPWGDNNAYRNVRVEDIRREFGILEALAA